jgi:hypothetical protein
LSIRFGPAMSGIMARQRRHRQQASAVMAWHTERLPCR